MRALATLVVRYRRLVLLAWLIVLAGSLAGVGHVAGRLSQQFSLPGQPGYEANQQILRAYGSGGPNAPLVPVVTFPAGQKASDPAIRGELAHGRARHRHAPCRPARRHGVGDRAARPQAGGGGKGPGVLAETLLGALGALVVLAFVFGSLLALVPLVCAAASILTTFLLVLGMTEVTSVSFLTQYLIALIG